MPTNNLPVEAYPREYILFLRRAAIEPVDVFFTGRDIVNPRTLLSEWKTARKIAQSTLHRINRMRQKMKETSHPDYALIMKASISVRGTEDEAFLHGEPRGHEALPGFHAAGLVPEELPADPLASLDHLWEK